MANKDRIYDYMQRPTYRPASALDFTKILGNVTLKGVESDLGQLVAERLIKKINGDRYVTNLAAAPDPVDHAVSMTGIITIIKSGAGFVKVENEDKDFFIDRNNVGNALNNDKVRISPLLKASERDLPVARVMEVISRAKDFFVAQVVAAPNNTLSVVADDQKMGLAIILDDYKNLVVGNKVLIKIGKYEDDKCYGTVSRVLGHVNDPGVDILSVVIDNGIKYEFDQATEDYVNAIDFKITGSDRKIRKDLSSRPIVTIDPWDAKDLDDAVYVEERADGTFFLSVSIADVSWFVKYGTPLDDEAVVRGTSVYLTDRVIPMLPHKLSNDICSLNQDVERFTLTCDIVVDGTGKYLSYEVYPSIIRSWRRFAYDEVNDYFAQRKDISAEKKEVAQSLLAGRKLHKILRDAKEKAGYVDFDIKEAKIVVDKNGVAVDVVARERGEAQMMIESFMIAANEAVVLKMNQLNHPLIYRVHDKPDGQKVKVMADLANKMGFRIGGDFENLKPIQVASWLEKQRDNPNYGLVAKLLLRSMAKAKYSTNNIGHFGLASSDYTHFTSPIRRYPDLIVHRIYWLDLFLPSLLTPGQKSKFMMDLPQLCEIASAREISAVTTEREVNNMKFAEYMLQHIGQEFDGVISTITNFGAYVELTNTVEGLLALRNMRDDFYVYDEKTMTLTGRNTRRTLSLGKKVRITVLSANKAEKRIDFGLVKLI